jgi:hypothetical protein
MGSRRARGGGIALAAGWAALALAWLACGGGAFTLVPGDAAVGEGGSVEGAAADADPRDAQPGDGSSDASADGARCTNLDAPFGAPAPVPGVNTAADEDSASLSSDERAMLLARRVSGSLHIYAGQRDTSGAFGGFALVSGVNVSEDTDPHLGPDGFVYWAHNAGDWDLHRAPLREAGVGAAQVLIATQPHERAPYVILVGGATRMFFASDGVPGDAGLARDGGDLDIYSVGVSPNGVVNLPYTPYPALNGASNDTRPVLSPDGLRIYFASDRPSGAGLLDIYTATRAVVTGAFAAPQRVAELSTASNDAPTWLSPDGCRLYFVSDRAGGTGLDLYVASKP